MRLRSRRDPAVWLPFVLVSVVLAAAAAWVHGWLSGSLEAIGDMAASDPERAISEATRLLRLCELGLCAFSSLVAVLFLRFFQLGLREARLPPSGWWSLGAWQAVVGPKAQRMSRLGLVFALLLPAASVATVLVIESLLRVLLAPAA